MPARKKRNNKPKSSKNTNQKTPITIHQSSSPTFQYQEEEKILKDSSMEDSSNGKVDEPKEVIVGDVGDSKSDAESVKTLDIVDDNIDNDNINPDHQPDETKRSISIVEEIADKVEKALDGDESSESSSSSSDDEDKEEEAKTEEKVESSNIMCVDAIPSIVEDLVSSVESKLKSSFENNDDGGEYSKGNEEKEDEEKASKAIDEAPIENVDQIEPYIPIVMPSVTRDSLQATSWKSCCGLFEVLRRSEN